ncbi:hypothetical protein ACFQY7_46770 [Actinomadura luteofluorescens]|uniref:hypothetical protein n=1 Tax=Actinomadura luteofluorescens TaxID=46163 RepID=UPI003625A0BE
MRNIPVDVSALIFVCVSAPRPKVLNQETGEVKVDRDGHTVITVGLSAADAMGRVDLLQVAVTGASIHIKGSVGFVAERAHRGDDQERPVPGREPRPRHGRRPQGPSEAPARRQAQGR